MPSTVSSSAAADQEVTVRNRTNVAAYEEAPSGVAGEQYASSP